MKLFVRLGLYALLLGTLFVAPRSVQAEDTVPDMQIDTWGANAFGQIGNGNTANSITPFRVAKQSNFQQVTGGTIHSLALRKGGTVWAWGGNDKGQLGFGDIKTYKKPIQVTALQDANIIQIAAAGNHSLALRTDGVVFSWGENNKGQVGNGKTAYVSTPWNVQGLPPIGAIGCGQTYSFAISKEGGKIYAWGENANGQFGDGTTTNKSKPTIISTLNHVVQIAGGAAHSLALKDDGTLWATGLNSSGQVGNGTTTQVKTWKQITPESVYTTVAVGAFHSLAIGRLKTEEVNQLWSWGANNKGQLGDGTTTKSLVPLATIDYDPQNPITQIAAGDSHSLQLRADGLVLGCGHNAFGQLGTDDTVDKSDYTPLNKHAKTTAIGAGSNHSIAVVRGISLDFIPSEVNYSAQFGTYVVFKALFKASSGASVLPNRSIKFYFGGDYIGTGVTDFKDDDHPGGVARFTYKIEDSITINDHIASCRFDGDAEYIGIDANSLATVTCLATDTRFPKPAALSGKIGASVVFEAKLQRSTDKLGLKGYEVIFFVDGKPIKDINGDPLIILTDRDGFARYRYTIPTKTKVGNHTIRATFGGTDQYNPSSVSWLLTVTN